MSNSQLNKLKSGIKNGTEAALSVSSNLIGKFNDETNFSHKLLLTNTQVSKVSKAFANGSSVNIKFLKTQLSQMMQLGRQLFWWIKKIFLADEIGKAIEKALKVQE